MTYSGRCVQMYTPRLSGWMDRRQTERGIGERSNDPPTDQTPSKSIYRDTAVSSRAKSGIFNFAYFIDYSTFAQS